MWEYFDAETGTRVLVKKASDSPWRLGYPGDWWYVDREKKEVIDDDCRIYDGSGWGFRLYHGERVAVTSWMDCADRMKREVAENFRSRAESVWNRVFGE